MKRHDRSGGAYAHWVRYTLASAMLAAGYGPAMPQQPEKSAAEAPAHWREFSAHLKAAFETALAGSDATALRLRSALAKQPAVAPSGAPLRVAVSIWIAGSGAIERVSFEPFADAQKTADLRTLLTRASAGPPPPDMLQPVRLILSLTARQ